MFTRCPGCKTVHPLDATLLAQGNGLYRCGNCKKVSNALQNLHDHWPEEESESARAEAASRQPPELGIQPEPVESQDPEITEEELELIRGPGFRDADSGDNTIWKYAIPVMVLLTVLNLWFISGDALMAQPSIRSALEKTGLVEPRPEQVFRSIDLLHLASSEMHLHPTLDESLILTATIVNRANQAQSYPSLQITLFDAQYQPLAFRVFEPDEYLRNGQATSDGLAPGAYLPVIMELLDPGQHAVGFEMKFL